MMFDAISAMQLTLQIDQLKLQTVNQNVVNMNTPAYKRQLTEHVGFDEHLGNQPPDPLQLLQKNKVQAQGVLNQTHNPNDVALTGPGYFQVQNNQGIFYTRRGDFHINEQGELATATNDVVLGYGGTIMLKDQAYTLDSQGFILIDNQKTDQLKVVQFTDPHQLHYAGNGLYQTELPPEPVSSSTRIMQGFIEQSNVKSVNEMLEMVKISRHFEASQRVMRTADTLLATAINQLGEGNV